MKTTTNKTDYRNLPLSAQLERGLELFGKGQYDLDEMLSKWGKSESPYIHYSPESDRLEVGVLPSTKGYFRDSKWQAKKAHREQDITSYPIVCLDGWVYTPSEYKYGEPRMELWTPAERQDIDGLYGGDYVAYLGTHSYKPSFLDRCVAAKKRLILDQIAQGKQRRFIEAGIEWLKEYENPINDYTKQPLSVQLERGLELFQDGEYDLEKMMKEWGQYTHPQISYDPASDSLVYSYRYGQYAHRYFGTAEKEAEDCLTEGVEHFPLMYVEGWENAPDDGELYNEPLNLWTEEEWDEICEKYDGDWEAWLEDHPDTTSYHDRCAGAVIWHLENRNYPAEWIDYIQAGIDRLKELEAEEAK